MTMIRDLAVACMIAMSGCGHARVAKTAFPPHNDVVVLLASDPSTWVKTGQEPELYTWSPDPSVLDHGRQAMRFERAAPERRDTSHEIDSARALVASHSNASWAATVANISGRGFVGKRIRLTANVKTDGAIDGAFVWLRVDHEGQRTLCNLQNPADLRLKGTHDFTPLSCVLDVPSGTSNIAFGLGLDGTGRAWIGPATIDEVGRDVAETPHAVDGRQRETVAGDDSLPGWVMSGGARAEYEIKLDPDVTRDGHPTLRLAPIADTQGRYATWMRSIDAPDYRAKRVRITAFTKSVGTTRRADFWVRVQGRDSPGDGPGLGARSIALGESDWTARTIVLDVDEKASQVQYGIGIAGPGKAWIDDPKIEFVGSDVALTAAYPGEQTIDDWLMTGVGAPDYALARDGNAVRIESSKSDRYVALVHVAPAASSTSGFMRCDATADVPDGAKWILYGVSYKGDGKAWVRGGSLH